MADISDQIEIQRPNPNETPSCSTRLLGDSFQAGAQAPASELRLPAGCLEFTILPGMQAEGHASDQGPGQALAFDSNFKRLDFGASAGEVLSSSNKNLGNLRFDAKFSETLLFDVNVKF